MCAQIDGHDLVPLLRGGVRQKTTQTDTNVANQAVESTNISYKTRAHIGVGHVTLKSSRGTTPGLNCRDSVIGSLQIDIGADHLGTFPRCQARNCLPIARRVTLTLKALTARAHHQNAASDETPPSRRFTSRLGGQFSG
jgi:hypothetical protein